MLRVAQNALPVLVSTALLTRVIWLVSPQTLIVEADALNWVPLVVLTAVLVVGLYLWDAVCLRWLFARSYPALSMGAVLSARGSSYLLSAVNYELGQGLLAWKLAQVLGGFVVAALASCLLLALHDIAVLLGLGLAGSLLSDEPLSASLRWVCGGGLLLLAILGMVGGSVLRRRRQQLEQTRWRAWCHGWSWLASVRLCVLRGLYFLIILVYVALALEICRVPLHFQLVCSVIPLVLLADGLPISVSGLGTRETALLYLLSPEQPGTLVTLSLIWSIGLVLGRLAIGLALWWVPGGAVVPSGVGREGEAPAEPRGA